jgi:RsiW-degrading membrane proteinase PrsW (M82 family)
MGVTREHIDEAVPALARWLRRVFWVLGGYIATTGLVVMYLARTELRTGNPSALAILVLAGVTSVGWMTAVNFMLRSDFRWALLALDGVWALGLVLAAGAR